MAERITWQQVAAPDFRDALQAQAQAANLFQNAASTLSGTFGSMDANRRADAAAAAMAKLQQVNDPAAFRAMIAPGGPGLESIGIDPNKLSSEVLGRIYGGYADQLQADQNAAYDRNRTMAANARADADQAKADAANALKTEAARYAYQIANSAMSPEEAIQLTLNQGRANKEDPLITQAKVEAIKAGPGELYGIGSQYKGDFLLTQEGRVANDQLTMIGNKIATDQASNTSGRFLSDARKQFGSGSGDLGFQIAQSVLGKVNPTAEKDNPAFFSSSAGQITDQFNQLRKEYAGLPPEMVAKAMQENLQSNGMIFSGDQIEFNLDAARAQLDQFLDPNVVAALDKNAADYDNATRQLNDYRQQFESIQTRYERGLTTGNQEAMDRAMADLAILAKSLSPAQKEALAQSGMLGGTNLTPDQRNAISSMGDFGRTMAPGADPSMPINVPPQFQALAQAAMDKAGQVTRPMTPSEARAQELAASGEQVAGAVPDVMGWGMNKLTQGGMNFLGGLFTAGGTIDSWLGAEKQGAWALDQGQKFYDYANQVANPAPAPASSGPAQINVPARAPLPSAIQQGLDAATNEDMMALFGQGPQPAPASAAPAPTAVPATLAWPKDFFPTGKDPVLQEAKQNPADAFTAVATELGLDMRPQSFVAKMVTSLKTGVNSSTGKPMSARELAKVRKDLAGVAQTLSGRYKGPANDPIQRLLANPKAWLK